MTLVWVLFACTAVAAMVFAGCAVLNVVVFDCRTDHWTEYVGTVCYYGAFVLCLLTLLVVSLS